MFQIGIYWLDVSDDGGLPVLDYRIWYASSSGNYQVLAVLWTLKTYTVGGLTTGVTYKFRV
jgi:hypothetical protein